MSDTESLSFVAGDRRTGSQDVRQCARTASNAAAMLFSGLRVTLASGLFVLLAGCNELLVDPGSIQREISLTIAPVADDIAFDGMSDAYAKVNRIRVVYHRYGGEGDPESPPIEVVRPFVPDVSSRVRVRIPVGDQPESGWIYTELLRGEDILFTAAADEVYLEADSLSEVRLQLNPYISRVVIAGDSILTATRGETLELNAALLFATGDTLPFWWGRASWTSSKDSIAFVENGTVFLNASGTAIIRAEYEGVSDEIQLTVEDGFAFAGDWYGSSLEGAARDTVDALHLALSQRGGQLEADWNRERVTGGTPSRYDFLYTSAAQDSVIFSIRPLPAQDSVVYHFSLSADHSGLIYGIVRKCVGTGSCQSQDVSMDRIASSYPTLIYLPDPEKPEKKW
ncbi:MAG: hypothetical protein LBG44_08880 [Gemmatimonadota bacterium]|nr:hypothetical protein [Gemmatimonadota bacterium]